MGFEEINKSILSMAPSKGKCEVCRSALDKLPSVSATTTFMFKKIQVRVCTLCAKELRSLIDLRITQAEKGEYQP